MYVITHSFRTQRSPDLLGTSGNVPRAIPVSPEALGGGPIGKIRDGDIVRVCAQTGTLEALVDAAEWAPRATFSRSASVSGGNCPPLFFNTAPYRSEERRVGKECVSTWRSR